MGVGRALGARYDSSLGKTTAPGHNEVAPGPCGARKTSGDKWPSGLDSLVVPVPAEVLAERTQ